MSRDLQFGTLADCATRAMVTITELACDLSPQESKQVCGAVAVFFKKLRPTAALAFDAAHCGGV